MQKARLTVSDVPVDSIRPNGWNTNVVTPENEIKIKESINRFGLFKPILVRNGNDGLQEIIGGEHRWMVAKKMGYETVPVISLGDIDDKTAKEIGLVDNGRYGEDDGLQLSELLRSIGPIEEVSSFLPYSGEEMKDMFKLTDSINFDDLNFDGLEDDIKTEASETSRKAPKTHVMVRFNVPIEDYDDLMERIEEIIRANGFDGDDSQTNAGNALVYALLRNNE